ncbi:MAG: hypothetical protein AAF533_30065, partial [Acidobacteriota bacterium]
SASPTVEDAFAILKNLEREGESGTATLWSYVIDLKEERIYWHTKGVQERKTFDLRAFDFSCATPAMLIDINIQLGGDMDTYFQAYSPELNRSITQAGMDWMDGVDELVRAQGGTLENAINTIAYFPETTNCTSEQG